MRGLPRLAAIVILLTIAVTVGACGGDDGDDNRTTSTPPSQAPSGGGGAAPPSSPSQLPPAFVECMAEQGYDVDSADIHSAPPRVLQTCFGVLHEGGG